MGDIYRHKKRGTTYEIVTHAIREHDKVPVVVYRSLEGEPVTWVRPSGEFYDGRFELLRGDPVITSLYNSLMMLDVASEECRICHARADETSNQAMHFTNCPIGEALRLARNVMA